MRSRASFITATLVLAICFVCHVAEIFDQWDHTLQTGDDTEYAFVVLALCVGVAYSLKWFVPRITLADSLIEAISYPRSHPTSSTLSNWFAVVPIPASPPAAALRI
ncbi:MAG: hypothetical protein WCA19_21610 [Candidatus Acidiferrales bacterium]